MVQSEPMLIDVTPGLFEKAAVKSVTRIVIDSTDAYLAFYHKFYLPYRQILSQGIAQYDEELKSVYDSIVFTIFSHMDVYFQDVAERVLSDLSLTHYSFFDVMSENPTIIQAYNDIASEIAMRLYIRLYTVGFLSDKNVYIVDHVYPSYCVLTLYPID